MDLGWPNGKIIFHSIRSILTSAPGGEFDIFEGVSLQSANQMTHHTGSGCTMPHGISQSGTALGTDCDSSPNNVGCRVVDARPRATENPSLILGGVWVTQFNRSGISMWSVPVSDHSSGVILVRLTRIRDQRCLKVESLPIPVNSELRQRSSLRPAATLRPSLQVNRSSSTLRFAVIVRDTRCSKYTS